MEGGEAHSPTVWPKLRAPAWGGELEKIENNFAGAGVEPAVCGVAYETTEPPLLYPRVKLKLRRRDLNSHQLVYKTSALLSVKLRRKKMMERVGFEPTPNSLQDCRSAKLSYHPKNKRRTKWLRRRDLNPRTFAYEANALPPELLRKSEFVKNSLAGLAGLEPAPTRLEDERSQSV